MSEVIYYKGLTIESEVDIARLTIEGQRLVVRRVGGSFWCDAAPGISTKTLRQLATTLVDASPELVNREAAPHAHQSILARGVDHWNTWRRHHPDVRPLLYGAQLSSESAPAELQGANFASPVSARLR